MLPAQQGYDRAITVFSPDGRLYQVEYAIETVRRGTAAVGVKCAGGIVMAGEERHRKLQVSDVPQKMFQIDDHLGAVAAGYIPDARSQDDNARFFSQSNRLIYDEPVEVEAVAKHLADQCQQFTQYAGVRPLGVSLILGGIDAGGAPRMFLTDPSGTYIQYDAIAIGSGADRASPFLEKSYRADMSLDEAAVLAAAGIRAASGQSGSLPENSRVRLVRIPASTGSFEAVPDDEADGVHEEAARKYPLPGATKPQAQSPRNGGGSGSASGQGADPGDGR